MSTPIDDRPRLHATVSGTAGPTVVLVHGFTQTSVSWRPVAERLAPRHRVVAVDAPSHGGSGAIHADLAEGARLLAGLAEVGDPAEAVWVGYSMGARHVLRLALDADPAPGAAVLVGATAGIDDPHERAERRAADEALAVALERDGVDAFLERWIAQPLFGPRPLEPDDLAARRSNRPDDLATSLRLAGTATMDPPWWGELGRLHAPTLVVWGEHDAKFAALGRRLADAIGPSARTASVAGAHHAAHLDRPAEAAALIEGVAAALR